MQREVKVEGLQSSVAVLKKNILVRLIDKTNTFAQGSADWTLGPWKLLCGLMSPALPVPES